MQATLDFTGQQLKDAGIVSVEDHSAEWQGHAADVIADLAATGQSFSTDDFHARLRYLPHHPNAIGAAFRRAQKSGVSGVSAGSSRSAWRLDRVSWRYIRQDERRRADQVRPALGSR